MSTKNQDNPILSISVAAQLLGLHPRTLMLYEREKLIMPHRTGTNRRLFSMKDLEDLQFLKYLTQEKGINLQGAKYILQAIRYDKERGIDLKVQLFPDFKAIQLI